MTFSRGWFQHYPPQTAALLSAAHSTQTKAFYPMARTQRRVSLWDQWSGIERGLPIVDSWQRTMEESQPPTVICATQIEWINSIPEIIFSFHQYISLSGFHILRLVFPHSFIGNCTKQRSCHPILLRLTMRTWTRMRSVMTIFWQMLLEWMHYILDTSWASCLN